VRNWKTTNPLLNVTADAFGAEILFFRAVMGLKPDRTKAGYMPESRETTIQRRTRKIPLAASPHVQTHP